MPPLRTGAIVRYDEQAQAPTFEYVLNGVRHIVWFENARSFAAKLNLARELGLPKIGVWPTRLRRSSRLGYASPGAN